MELNKTYNPTDVEHYWYAQWLSHKLFKSTPDHREPYTIVIPPPNVTGVLHMGHMLNNTIQDALIRKARMEGKNACWVPGTDHASIATEARVVAKLREAGIKKSDLSREDFLKHAFEWKEQYGGTILEQLKKLGSSCDWDRTYFTMDETYYKAVIKVFVDLYKKGHIYRGLRMINWDCEAQTALSNEEVLHNENGEQSQLYSIRYKIEGSTDEWITIATTRPETIMADSAIAINPTDERYAHLKGKRAIIPFVERSIPIIFDEYVEKDFGTGCLKVTPAHDTNDYELGQKHNLEVIDIINNNGTINELCGIPKFVGLDRFKVRKEIVKNLEADGFLVKTETIINKVGRSERTNSVVEPKLSLQWFIRMKEIAQPALDAVENGDIDLVPSKFKNVYKHWMENVRDWCISRQLWWGHRIPAYYLPDGNYVVAESTEQALLEAQKINASYTLEDLKQDEDVLDTWASSWLWPIAVFEGFDTTCFNEETGKIDISNNVELNYYYPTQVLVTAPEILFFWVARMAIAGFEYIGKRPFETVYLTGIVRDKQGRKMSKSLGNSPDALELIKTYGADGVRFGMLASSPAGNDLLFDEKLCEQGRNFTNKLWNALRLIKGWEVYEGTNEENKIIIEWFEYKLHAATEQLHKDMEGFRLSEALMNLYNFIWNDFCSWYLEFVKPAYQQPIDQYTIDKTVYFLEQICALLHPFMPFVTEEIWQKAQERAEGTFLCVANYPKETKYNATLLQEVEDVKQLITGIREIRSKHQLKNSVAISCFYETKNATIYTTYKTKIARAVNADKLEAVSSAADMEQAETFVSKADKIYVHTGVTMNSAVQKEKIEEEIKYTKGFIESVEKKLQNERFVSTAPEKVVDLERKKLADGIAKLQALEESLAAL